MILNVCESKKSAGIFIRYKQNEIARKKEEERLLREAPKKKQQEPGPIVDRLPKNTSSIIENGKLLSLK